MQSPSNNPGSSWDVLRYRDFRWMFIAQFISTIGSSMQLAAVNWHIWDITHDKIALGLVGLVRVVPIIILSLLGGVIADAVDRRRLLVFTQSGMLVFAGILGLATLSGRDSLPVIYLMTAALSGLVAFDQPARNALLPNLVPLEQISNAARLNVVLFQITSVLGPVAAGLLIGQFGPALAYIANALSFIPVVIVLILIHVPPIKADLNRGISFKALGEGLRFVRQSPILWGSMVLDFFATFFASAMALLPVYASDILKVGAEGYGLLYAAPSIGAVLGAVAMAQYGARIKRQGEVLLGAVAVYGLATILFGVSSIFIFSAVALALTGLSDSISTAIRGTLRQIITPDRLRGRMLSVNMMFFMGGPQLGEFEAGALAQITSAPISVVVGGVGAIAIVAWLALRVPALRNYREMPVAAMD